MDLSKTFVMLVLVSGFVFTCCKPTKRYRYDAEFLDSEIQRIRAGKAGHELEPIWTVTKSPSKKMLDKIRYDDLNTENEREDSKGDENENEDFYDYESSEEIEITCAPGKGWHIRGQRCVSLNCPGGPEERDFNTGECLYSHQPKGRFIKTFQQWNDLKYGHVYRSSPMSTHFVRSMVLMRKG